MTGQFNFEALVGMYALVCCVCVCVCVCVCMKRVPFTNIDVALEWLISTYLQTPTLGNFSPLK